MNLITAEHLTHSYTERLLLDDTSFSLGENEKVGIIGINGTGKSTLLKILAGIVEPDSGKITMGRNLRIGYLSQKPEFANKITALEAALPLKKDIADSPANYEPQAKNMMNKLGFKNHTQPIEELSGGQRKRIALIRTLLTPADILILDEPTNHLDSAMNEWLEDYLKKYRGALIMITHDRYFLDTVVNRIVEIDKGKLYSYECNYLGFLERKAQREEIANATERKRQSLLKTEIAWMMRGARARSTKQKAHIQRYENLRDMKAPATDSTIEISSASSRLGKTTIELEHISKSYDNIPVISDFTYFFLRNDRVGIIGPNGCGKSTLMNIITGNVTPDSGIVTIGQTVKIGYFSQENEAMDESLRVIDYVREGGEVIHTKDGTVSASVMLERFLFPPDQQYSIIGKLSGGEKRRLYLLRILMEAPNILILDEPTNDLDIATLTRLEDYLDSFEGIVITVSHDRYFLDRVVSRIFCFENGTIKQYEGGYTDYLNHTTHKLDVTDAGISSSEKNSPDDDTAEETDKPKVTKDNWKDGQTKKLKMSYKEEKEFETIENDIATLEQQIEDTDNEMLKAANDFVKLGELSAKKEELQKELEHKMDRWMYLEELADKIAGNA
ncbi:aBC transporter ATP-binding protein [Clostridium sp. CAG:122]|jgi:ABC transport system ATP-binding/permease protein|uniref:Zinc/iron permease n=2 Tax=Butyribacter intestini TaxID=1703332 RepID=A0AAW3JQ57_9FIRM|nr:MULTISPECIES: ABC-F family ATP-binding cassette domain-containing protein [Clostridia]UYJ41778.1 MAG: ABC-F family ATP-binding cassette domain-containing protein [Lachnospiraceae bacterium]CCZ41741.1 aBC transporter ATP-binding protein [Clostridium sp. CAG:122]KQC84823.1 zinc/iron permease [Butyribacter intestini]RHP27946.1 ABC transporter ATP-binding protein [Clostridium sp. AF34-13]RHU74098.1 ABC transporter ATP-binding protein [Butyribacter intestini]